MIGMIVIDLPIKYDHDEGQLLFVLLRCSKRTLCNILLEITPLLDGEI